LHYKLQHLFCGALYKQSKWKKRAVPLGLNLSNGVTDTLESSSILIYFKTRKSIYTPQGG